MEATLSAPSGKSELCEIRDLPESLYDIKFTPWEEGIHTVSLKYKGLHIAGKPYDIWNIILTMTKLIMVLMLYYMLSWL